ncbi:MAG: DUF2911 domain-containing protein [Verrucomicrobiota bacterium]|nr:DUF2911 domain-containing protein [Verrucomicrobiota bacterium]
MKLALLVLPALLSIAVPLFAQEHKEEHKVLSPLDTVTANVDGAEIKISYSRPFTKHPETGAVRKIWGTLVPYGKVWRTGANNATTLTTSQPLEFGGTTIPAGTYSLFTIPEENGGKLIINKQTGQSGLKYDEKQDVVRVDMKRAAAEKPVDQFTIAIDKGGMGGGSLKLTWENAEYSVPFTVKK